jgi:hypothetical protein
VGQAHRVRPCGRPAVGTRIWSIVIGSMIVSVTCPPARQPGWTGSSAPCPARLATRRPPRAPSRRRKRPARLPGALPGSRNPRTRNPGTEPGHVRSPARRAASIGQGKAGRCQAPKERPQLPRAPWQGPASPSRRSPPGREPGWCWPAPATRAIGDAVTRPGPHSRGIIAGVGGSAPAPPSDLASDPAALSGPTRCGAGLVRPRLAGRPRARRRVPRRPGPGRRSSTWRSAGRGSEAPGRRSPRSCSR